MKVKIQDIFLLMFRSYVRAETGRASLIAGGCAFYATLAIFPAINALLSIYHASAKDFAFQGRDESPLS